MTRRIIREKLPQRQQEEATALLPDEEEEEWEYELIQKKCCWVLLQ